MKPSKHTVTFQSDKSTSIPNFQHKESFHEKVDVESNYATPSNSFSHSKKINCESLHQHSRNSKEKLLISLDLNKSPTQNDKCGKINWVDPNSSVSIKPIKCNTRKCKQTKQEIKPVNRCIPQQNDASQQVVRPISRHFSHEDIRDRCQCRNNKAKRTVSVDDVYLKCVDKIETIKFTLDQTSAKCKPNVTKLPTNVVPNKCVIEPTNISTKDQTPTQCTCLKPICKCSKPTELSTKEIPNNSACGEPTNISTDIIPGNSEIESNNIYVQKQICMFTLIFGLPFLFISGLTYGILGWLVFANYLLILCLILK